MTDYSLQRCANATTDQVWRYRYSEITLFVHYPEHLTGLVGVITIEHIAVEKPIITGISDVFYILDKPRSKFRY